MERINLFEIFKLETLIKESNSDITDNFKFVITGALNTVLTRSKVLVNEKVVKFKSIHHSGFIYRYYIDRRKNIVLMYSKKEQLMERNV